MQRLTQEILRLCREYGECRVEAERMEEARRVKNALESVCSMARAVEEGKELEKQKEEEREVVNDYIVEPSAEQLIADLIPTVLSQKLFTAAVDSNASEHAARTLAMQVATDNANELIQDLTKQYNKSRQQAITNELLDIVGGSMQ